MVLSSFIADLFQYKFLSNAVIASVLAGICCGIIGTYIVTRRLVFLSGGITHSSFGGIGIAYYLGINPLIGAALFAVASAFGIELFAGNNKVREDSTIGILWSFGMAIGIVFVFLTPGYAPNLMSFLFGNILLVTQSNIISLAIFNIVLIAAMTLLYRPIIYTACDRNYAKTQGLPVRAISLLMLILVSLSIVLNIRVVGIVLLVSLLTIPAVVANLLTKNYLKMTILSTIIAIIGTLMGLYVSYALDIPAGASTVVLLAMLFFVVRLIKR